MLQAGVDLDLLAQISRKSSISEESQRITYPTWVSRFRPISASNQSESQTKCVRLCFCHFLKSRTISPLFEKHGGPSTALDSGCGSEVEAVNELPDDVSHPGWLSARQRCWPADSITPRSPSEFNKDQLLQGLDGLDEVMKHILSQDLPTIQLGHVAEIAKLVFHHHF